jgi:phage-related baseplate assembly protein
VAAPNNPAWNGSNGYSLGASVASVTVPVQAVTAGSAGNVQPNTIQVIKTSIPGVDTVTNEQALTGGMDPESDSAFRARFQLYINSRSLATGTAVEFAIASLQQGLRYAVLENVDTRVNPRPGNFCVVLDDGTGYPPTSLINEAGSAIEAVRPIGATYAVIAPLIVEVGIAMTVSTSNPLTALQVATEIQQNVLAWIAALPIAGTLAISMIEAIAHNTDPSVVSVSGTTINGNGSDVTAPSNGVLLCSGVTVN